LEKNNTTTVASLFKSNGALDDKMWLYSSIDHHGLKFGRRSFSTYKGHKEWDKVIQRFAFDKLSEMMEKSPSQLSPSPKVQGMIL
jgi:hypothetical protein